MERPSAVDHEVTEDGWVLLTFLTTESRRGALPLAHLPWEPRGLIPARVVGSLGVRYARENPDDPTSQLTDAQQVSLYLPEGVTPTAVRRFAWSRWLDVADAIAREEGIGKGSHQSWFEREPAASSPGGKLRRAIFAEHGYKVNLRGRPGRKGHPQEFYETIARSYMERRKAGSRSPTKDIAQEMKYSRDTVAGWVKRTRELGLLAPARRGRPG